MFNIYLFIIIIETKQQQWLIPKISRGIKKIAY